jgi:hypothetical protein
MRLWDIQDLIDYEDGPNFDLKLPPVDEYEGADEPFRDDRDSATVGEIELLSSERGTGFFAVPRTRLS